MNDTKKTILIVEDEKPILALLADKLNEAGFNVLRATDGKEGLAMALKQHPDLILLDIVMPLVDGLEMAEKLREDQWGKDAMIVILTNLPMKETEARNLGIYEYITKANTGIEDLIDMVKKKLS